jgi:putative CocE/NonD family hydrolase
MVPWEGRADQYRDATYHGGIFGQGFVTNWFTTHMAHHLLGRAYRNNPDAFQINFLWFLMRHSLDTGAFRPMQAQWDRIEVPFLAAGNWSGSMGQHLRGATEGFMRAASKHKKLRLHAGTHYHAFYSDDGRNDQLRFLDYWLKDIETGAMDEPPVKLAIRHGNNAFEWRYESEWPIARTQWTKLYFDLDSTEKTPASVQGRLAREAPARVGSHTYPASGATRAGHASSSSTSLAMGLARSGISLQTDPFPEDTEITGPLAAVLWVSSDTEDMDVFLTVRNIDPNGNDVFEDGQQGQPIPITKGWLRASHRDLDPELSLPYRPYHRHVERKELEPGEVVRLDIEIWPTSMVFKKGHQLRLDVQPRDGIGSAPFTHYHADYNVGANTIHSGPGMESYLLVPVIPPRQAPGTG